MSIEQLIKENYQDLSPGQKKVAEFLLSRIEYAAFLTAVQIGRESDVSETTVTRLSYALGFNGFSQMQASIQQQVLTQNGVNYINADAQGEDSSVEVDKFTSIIEKEIGVLRQLEGQLNKSDVWQAVDWLIEADNVLITGYRASYGAASWLYFMLNQSREDVYLSSSSASTFENVISLTERSVVFVISFPRYSKETLHIVEGAKQQGAKVITITDRILSPVGRISDIAFIIDDNNISEYASSSAVMTLLNIIMVGVSEKNQEKMSKRSKQLEQLYSKYGVFVE